MQHVHYFMGGCVYYIPAASLLQSLRAVPNWHILGQMLVSFWLNDGHFILASLPTPSLNLQLLPCVQPHSQSHMYCICTNTLIAIALG